MPASKLNGLIFALIAALFFVGALGMIFLSIGITETQRCTDYIVKNEGRAERYSHCEPRSGFLKCWVSDRVSVAAIYGNSVNVYTEDICRE